MPESGFSDRTAEARRELEKAFVLASNGIPIDVFSEFIDAVWHDMLADEKSYADFCIEACGHVVGHRERSGRGFVGFVESYERRYGPLPEIWFLDGQGCLDRDRWDRYRTSGIVEASWNCTPTHNCMRKEPARAPVHRERRTPEQEDDRSGGSRPDERSGNGDQIS